MLNTNPILIIDFYANSQAIVQGLTTKHPIYLKAGELIVSLLITEVCKGEFELTQVVLKPTCQLTKGVEYELYIDNVPEYEQAGKRWNNSKRSNERVKWTVTEREDRIAPHWSTLPKYSSKTLVEYGCGPARWVYFDLGFEDESEILIKTTVKNLRTGKMTFFHIQSSQNRIKVGHGMCSGAFYFKTGDEYEVVFSLIDASGNLSDIQTKPIQFSRPEIETREE
jgi:hypothetical protein